MFSSNENFGGGKRMAHANTYHRRRHKKMVEMISANINGGIEGVIEGVIEWDITYTP
jgi:hypothetical protein